MKRTIEPLTQRSSSKAYILPLREIYTSAEQVRRWARVINDKIGQVRYTSGFKDNRVLDWRCKRDEALFGSDQYRYDRGLLYNESRIQDYIPRLLSLYIDMERQTNSLSVSQRKKRYARRCIAVKKRMQCDTDTQENEKRRMKDVAMQVRVLAESFGNKIDCIRLIVDRIRDNKRHLKLSYKKQGNSVMVGLVARKVKVKDRKEEVDVLFQKSTEILQSKEFVSLEIAERSLQDAKILCQQLDDFKKKIDEEDRWLLRRRIRLDQARRLAKSMIVVDRILGENQPVKLQTENSKSSGDTSMC